MLTIKAEVLKKSLKKDGTYNVKIRLSYKRQVKRLSTNLFAKPSDIIMRSFKLKDGTDIRIQAEEIVNKYQRICSELQLEFNDYTLDDIILYIRRKQKISQKIDFISFSREWISKSKIKGVKNYTSALNSFISFIGKNELDISTLTVRILNSYKQYLLNLKESREEATSNRMLSLYLGSIRHLFNEAQRHYNDYDQDIILIPRSPFDYFRVPKQESTRKRALQPCKIKEMFNLPYSNIERGRKGTCRYDIAKDCFILSFCLMGMNSADLYNCTNIEDNTITYYRTKTKDRRQDNAKMIVNIPEIIEPIVQRYRDSTGRRVFKFYQYYSSQSTFNKAINKGLKQIGELLDIEDLEYYAARHSWATIAINQVGIDKYTVHSALNHYDSTMKVTDIYIEKDFRRENEANKKVIEFVFK